MNIVLRRTSYTVVGLLWCAAVGSGVTSLWSYEGAAGVAGAGFVALAATLPTLGILPVGGLALLLGVERFMSEIRAVTNLFSNIFATVVISKWMGELDHDRLHRVLDGGEDAPLPRAVEARA